MSESSMVPLDKQPTKTVSASSGSNLSDEVYELRKKILNAIIDEASTLIDIQSATNRSFKARTCPRAALSLEEAALYQLTRK